MEIFSFISLVLSIFGASLAAFSGLRSHYESEILEAFSDAPEKVKEIAGRGNKSKKKAENKEKSLRVWVSAWTRCQWVPIAFFSILVFLIVLHVSVGIKCENGIFVKTTINSTTARYGIGVFFLMNVLCFALALVSRFFVKTRYSDLEDLQTVARDSSPPDVF